MNEPDQSASVVVRPTFQTTAQSFLPVSVYLGRSHSSFSCLVFSSFALFILFSFSFPGFHRLIPAADLCTSPGRTEKKVLRASRWPKWQPSTMKANWAPRQLFLWKRVLTNTLGTTICFCLLPLVSVFVQLSSNGRTGIFSMVISWKFAQGPGAQFAFFLLGHHFRLRLSITTTSFFS